MLGLAGLGYWGRNLFRNLHEMGVLRVACDAAPATLEDFQERYPDTVFTSDFDDLTADPLVSAIVISTPAATHYELVKRSLEAGKDVFVEKPLALTVAQGEELVRIAASQNRVLMVGHILHYHPAVIKLKEMLVAGELGKIQYVYSNRLNIGRLRTEENILWSFAPHDISAILQIMGQEPVSISAMGGEYLNPGIADTTLTLLEFANGVKAHVFVSWLHPFKEQKLVIVGSEAMAVFDDVSNEKLRVYPHKIEWIEGIVPVAQKADYSVITVDPGEPLRLELNHFVDCVNTRQQPFSDGSEGVRVLKVLDAAQRSLNSRPPEPGAGTQEAGTEAFVHETAVVDAGVRIGAGTKVWHFSHIQSGAVVGAGCTLGQNVNIGPDVTIGDRCKIQNNVSVYRGVTLEDEVFCGPSCVFTNVYNPRAFIDRKDEFLATLVRCGATIGANASVVCGTTIGRYAMVGAGAVVKTDVADYAIVAGVPAKQIGWACKCGMSLMVAGGDASCPNCGSVYKQKGNALIPVKEI